MSNIEFLEDDLADEQPHFLVKNGIHLLKIIILWALLNMLWVLAQRYATDYFGENIPNRIWIQLSLAMVSILVIISYVSKKEKLE